MKGLSGGILYSGPRSLLFTSIRSTLPSSVDLYREKKENEERKKGNKTRPQFNGHFHSEMVFKSLGFCCFCFGKHKSLHGRYARISVRC